MSQAARAKEFLQLRGTLVSHNPTSNLDNMVEASVPANVVDRPDGAGLGIGTSVHYSLDARVQCRSDAHHARFQSDIQRRIVEDVATNPLRRRAHRDNLRMIGFVFYSPSL